MHIFFKTPLRRLATFVSLVVLGAFLTAFIVHVPKPQNAETAFKLGDYPAPDAPPLALPAGQDYDISSFFIKGTRLARIQLERGAPKRLDSQRRRDQSFEGLRDILDDSNDPKILMFAPLIDQLEDIARERDANADRDYTETFVKEFYPLASFVEERSGIPAKVVLAQIVVESGWGTSNITILKNNLMGIGNATRAQDFVVPLDLGDFHRDIRVHCMKDTTAFRFENIADSVLYYVYVLLESPDNVVHYADLRKFVAENAQMRRTAPKEYRKQIIDLIAKGYHSDPDWYSDYLTRFTARLDSMLDN